MPAKNIECQLAQGQIGRYLRGEHISAEAVHQLESHIADCSECTETLLQRRQAIVSMMGDKLPTRAVVEVPDPQPEPEPAPKPVTPSASARLVAALSSVNKQPGVEAKPNAGAPEVKPAVKKPLLTKPILFSLGLAVVLVAMSYYSRSASALLGPTASAALPTAPVPPPARHSAHVTIPPTPPVATTESPATESPAATTTATAAAISPKPKAPATNQTVPPTSKSPASSPTVPPAPANTPDLSTAKPAAGPAAITTPPTSRPAITPPESHVASRIQSPQVTIRRRSSHRIHRLREVHAKPAGHRHRPNNGTTIRVYDAQGNPIQP